MVTSGLLHIIADQDNKILVMQMTTQAKPIPALTCTVAEFCRAVGIWKTFFYEELRAGRIKARKAGAKTLITVTECHEYLERLPAATLDDLSASADGSR